jgi:hypothetical protein
MALVNVPTVASASTQKQITINCTVASPAVVYTVPVGKTFTGFFTSSSPGYVQINGIYMYVGGYNYFAYTPVPVTLLAGTTVTGASTSYTNLIGIEQ